MKQQAETIITVCYEALQAVRLDPAAKGAALQRAHAQLNTAGQDAASLTNDERQRLASLSESASGFLESLSRHGAVSTLQGGLEALRRRGELV
jgi:hypothetical protein